LTILNTFSTVIGDIIRFGSRGRQNFEDITNFQIKSFRLGVKKWGWWGDSKHTFLGGLNKPEEMVKCEH
jgi:hypothetical protein